MDYTKEYFNLLIETTQTRDYNKLKKCMKTIIQTGGKIDQNEFNNLVKEL